MTCQKTSVSGTERSFGSLPIEAGVLLLFFVFFLLKRIKALDVKEYW